MGKLFRLAIVLMTIALAIAPIRVDAQTAAAQSTEATRLPSVPITGASPSISPTPAAATASSAAVSATPAMITTPAAAVTPAAASHGAPAAGAVPPRAARTPVASLPHSIDHVFYGRPAMPAHATPAPTTAAAAIPTGQTTPLASTSPTTPAPTPAAVATPVAATTPIAMPAPAAAPTAIAAIVAPAPPTSAPAPAASPSTVSADHSAEGLRLFLSDPVSATSNSFNWSVTAIKSRHEIEVFYKRRLYKHYHAVFGRSRFGGPKQWEGDRRTPEGNYLIVSKHRSARFGWFLKINYPNAVDQANFIHMKADGDIPRGMREGDGVGLHGTDLPILNIGNINWTTGCVSIDNADISELARLLPIGTLVVIKP